MVFVDDLYTGQFVLACEQKARGLYSTCEYMLDSVQTKRHCLGWWAVPKTIQSLHKAVFTKIKRSIVLISCSGA